MRESQRAGRLVRRRRAIAVSLALGLTLAACGGGDTDADQETEDAGTQDTDAEGAEEGGEEGDGEAAAEGRRGGTLVMAGNADVLYLDPAAAYSPGDYQVMRAIHRGLFEFLPDEDILEGTTPRADIATEVPTVENGGISEDGLTYTIELRDGVMWDAPDGPREVVADDVVLGAERGCNPVQGITPRGYFTSTIVGFAEFCDAFAEVEPEVEAIRSFIEENEIEGVRAIDDKTVEFELVQPASDFLNILALGKFTSPHPVEYLDYLPDSPDLRQNTISNGPYRITEYVPEQSFVFERNEHWDPETDDLREAYVDRIEISMGQEATSVSQQIMAGTVDMQWNDTIVPTSEIPALVSQDDERLAIGGDGSINPYAPINTLSPNADGAFADPLVRQALNVAVNKGAIQQVLGGEGIMQIANTILPPEVLGNIVGENPLEVTAEGDPERARELLAEAGYPDGVPVKLLYRDSQPYPDIATVMEQDLSAAGFEVELVVTTQNAFYGEWLLNQELTEDGGWDVAIAAWGADYLGNAGRANMVPMLDGRNYEEGSANFGGWNNDEFNETIDAALSAATPEEAAESWAEADRIATMDAAWVPLGFKNTPTIRSERVGGFIYHSNPHNGDMVNVWIEE
jgi:peptide/nickel transport system substrate-binding protein